MLNFSASTSYQTPPNYIISWKQNNDVPVDIILINPNHDKFTRTYWLSSLRRLVSWRLKHQIEMNEWRGTILSRTGTEPAVGLGGLQPPLPLVSKRSPIEPSSEISIVDVQVEGAEICWTSFFTNCRCLASPKFFPSFVPGHELRKNGLTSLIYRCKS